MDENNTLIAEKEEEKISERVLEAPGESEEKTTETPGEVGKKLSEEDDELYEYLRSLEKELAELPEDASWWQKHKLKRRIKKEKTRIKEEQKTLIQDIFELVAFAAVALCVALIVKNYVGQPILVDGESMSNTLMHHDFVWANKLGYDEPERFDIVIVQPYAGEKTLYIKRVIALPGETIFVDDDNKIHITPADSDTSYVLEDEYGDFLGVPSIKKIECPNNADGSYTLGEDEYFCMGDNRYHSLDSRSLGAFSREQIKGHAVFRMLPFKSFGKLD